MSGPVGVTFSDISVGKSHSCGVDTSGVVHCWGDNRHVQTSSPTEDRFVSVSAGDTHSCGVRDDRSMACWGQEISGVVRELPRVEKFRSVSAGGEHTCAVKEDGTGECWGVRHAGIAQPDLSRQFVAMAVGGKHVCAVVRTPGGGSADSAKENVECWASNNWNQARPPTGEHLVDITAGHTFTCGLRPDQTAVCWGENRTGGYQTAEGERLPDHFGITAPEEMRFTMIDSGNYHVCGLREDATMFCWGYMAEM